MSFSVKERKSQRIRAKTRKILRDPVIGRRWVKPDQLAMFCGTCVPLSLAIPCARFYTRSIYSDISINRKRDVRGRVRLSRQSLRDLGFCKKLKVPEMSGRPVQPPQPDASLHTDEADVGYGCTLNETDLSQGIYGLWRAQGIWDWRSCASSITLG